MEEHGHFKDLLALATFSREKMQKTDCYRSDRLFVGINCLSRGQSQRIHEHEAADKFYLVLSGKARITVGTETRELGPGGLAWADAGVPHGIAEAVEDAVLLVGMAPPPSPRGA